MDTKPAGPPFVRGNLTGRTRNLPAKRAMPQARTYEGWLRKTRESCSKSGVLFIQYRGFESLLLRQCAGLSAQDQARRFPIFPTAAASDCAVRWL